jgi:putative redox protein
MSDASTIQVELLEGYCTRAGDTRHEVCLDEPAERGGTDRGLTPTQTLLVSLGSCAAITMRMYAERKGWGLTGAKVTVRLERPKDGDPRITQEILLEGDLDAEQRERLRQIAGRCPVHRLVEGPLVMEERLVG